MRFLRTLFWIVVAVLVTFFAVQNWRDVTIDLWGDLQADIKIPILLAVVYLIGFLPVWTISRARLWTIRRQTPVPVAPAPVFGENEVEEEEAR